METCVTGKPDSVSAQEADSCFTLNNRWGSIIAPWRWDNTDSVCYETSAHTKSFCSGGGTGATWELESSDPGVVQGDGGMQLLQLNAITFQFCIYLNFIGLTFVDGYIFRLIFTLCISLSLVLVPPSFVHPFYSALLVCFAFGWVCHVGIFLLFLLLIKT